MTAVLSTLAVAALIFVGLMSAAVLNAVLRLRVQRPETVPLASQEVAADIRKLLAPGLAHLLELGFAHPASMRLTWLRIAGQPVAQHALVLTHERVPAAGYVMQLAMPDRGRHYSVYFVSRTSRGHTLVTRNRAGAVGPMPLPDFTTQDCWLPTWAAVWQAHRRRMKALQPDPSQWQRLGAEEWLRAGGQAEAAAFDLRLKRGELVDAGDGSWRASLAQALLTVARAWAAWIPASRGMDGDKPARVAAGTAAAAAAPAVANAAGASDAEGLARLVQSYEHDSLQRRTPGWSNGAKWLVFFITAAAAAGSFGLSMGWEVLPALLCVLLFHELGHFAAMRRAGYRDLKVFFLPFLGAAVSGRHESPSARQELIVLFAGPVPGLVLGLAGLLWLPAELPGGDWWRSCALLAVTVNAFNLLPIHPLDGGKIFEILLLGRWPWLAFAGRVLGLAALGYFALTMDSPAARTAVGAMLLLMTLGLAHQYREARLAAALRSAGKWGGLRRGEALQALFGTMGRIGLLRRPWPDLRVMADALLPALTRPRLRRRDRAGGLAVYTFFLLLPVLALMFGMWSAAQRPAERAASARPGSPSAPTQAATGPAGAEMEPLFAAVQRRVLEEADAGRRWTLLASEFAPLLDGLAAEEAASQPTALALLQEAQRLAPTLPDPVAKQARAALWQAQVLADRVERRQLLAGVIQRYDDAAAAEADPAPLAEAAIEWLYDRPADAASRLAVIDKVMARLQATGSVERLPQLQEFKLDHLLAQGDANAARQLAQQWLAAASSKPGSETHLQTARQWAEVLLLTEGPAAALQAVDEVLQALDARATGPAAYELDSLRRSGLWLAEAAGRTDWQRRQVQHLQTPVDPQAALPWWIRLLSWGVNGGRQAPATLPQLEHAHWRGDVAEAGKLAEAVCRRPGIAARLSSEADDAQPLSAARHKLVNNGRRAMCERYGAAVAARP